MGVVASTMDPAGPAAREIDALWQVLLWLGVAVFVLFVALLGLALRRRAADEAADRDDATDALRAARPWIVGGGVVLPTVVVVVVLVATILVMRIAPAEGGDGALTVEVTGNQWWWEVAYPDHGVETANEVHIPTGEPVVLELTSSDVIHSFWVPDLAGKLDALPDDVNRLTIEADRPGRYQGACAEFCGLQHANMEIVVIAHGPDEFERWIEDMREPAAEPTSAAARRGVEVFQAADCGSCHTVAGTSATGDRAPVLTHLMDRGRIAGGVLELTPESLRRWLDDPHEVKEGTSMPDPELSAEDVAALAAYLEELR